MRRWQKFLFLLIVLILLSLLPFSYRRRKLVGLDAAIQQLKSQRTSPPNDPMFAEYKGVTHVHSFLGGHSSGSFQEIIDGAKSNDLAFVVMTEHNERDINTAAMTLQGNHGGVLFLNGNEVSIEGVGRVLIIPGLASQDDARLPLETLATNTRQKLGLTVAAYPQEFTGWGTNTYDGVEVYNVYTNAQQINPVAMFFDGLWSYRSYPDLLFANFYDRPSANLRLWDQELARGRRLTALAGNDAHANIGLALNDSSGNSVLSLHLDPYERSFRLVRVHALVPQGVTLNSQALLTAFREGHCFIGFDLFSDTTGFRFVGRSGAETRIQGDELRLQGEAHLSVAVPLSGRIVLRKNGIIEREEYGSAVDFEVKEPGAYRCEVYLPQLPHPVREQPWIISNPIYVR
jgi:hypothetical protein